MSKFFHNISRYKPLTLCYSIKLRVSIVGQLLVLFI